MPASGLYSRHVRAALKRPMALWTDALLVAIFLSIFGALLLVGRQMAVPFSAKVEIDLSFWSLPKYAVLSLGRGFAAYFLSLAFTLVYGTIAAHHRRAEAVMLPVLDVLQAIPVLGFLPGVVLALVALFPTYEVGLEIACIVMIFTGQVWNMTFSFHGSLKAIPVTLREAAAVQRLSAWRIFRQLEVPAAMIGLVWNSMMSMAGGWFFLMVTEAFTLGDRDYRLPGIGSYMNEAVLQDNVPAMLAAVAAMVLMIVFCDQVVWRPLVVWSQRFKMDEVSDGGEPRSWVLELARRSKRLRWLRRSLGAARQAVIAAKSRSSRPAATERFEAGLRALEPVAKIAQWASLPVLVLGAATGGWSLARLLFRLPLVDSAGSADWKTVLLALAASLMRTSAAVVLGAAWTLPAGIFIGLSPRRSAQLQPVIQSIASFPAPMLFPLVTLGLAAMHVDFNIGCTMLMLLGTQWYILFNVIAGASSIPADLREVAAAYQFNAVRRWTRLYLPCVFPFLVTGLITAAGGAWNATIVAEYVKTRSETYSAFGLGSVISRASSSQEYPLLAASVVSMAIAVVTLNRLLWKRLYRLAEARFSLN